MKINAILLYSLQLTWFDLCEAGVAAGLLEQVEILPESGAVARALLLHVLQPLELLLRVGSILYFVVTVRRCGHILNMRCPLGLANYGLLRHFRSHVMALDHRVITSRGAKSCRLLKNCYLFQTYFDSRY